MKRVRLATKHIKRSINKLHAVLSDLGDAYSYSSYNSTTPTEQEAVARASARSSLKAYLTREDYAAEFTGKNNILRANVLTNMETTENLLFSAKPYSFAGYSDRLRS